MLTVSVIIPALNEQAFIRRAVSSAWEADANEVVVSDGGSHDATREFARAEGAKVVAGKPGRAIQQNLGAQLASSDMLLFQHADCWLGSDAIRQIRQAAAERDVLVGGFRQRIENGHIRFRLIERGNAARIRWLRTAYGDQGIFVRRPVFEQIGGFDSVALMEDVLLIRQLRRRGQPILLPGPIHISDRRWVRNGVVRQTLKNWALMAAFQLGVPPDRLASFYPRHDQ